MGSFVGPFLFAVLFGAEQAVPSVAVFFVWQVIVGLAGAEYLLYTASLGFGLTFKRAGKLITRPIASGIAAWFFPFANVAVGLGSVGLGLAISLGFTFRFMRSIR